MSVGDVDDDVGSASGGVAGGERNIFGANANGDTRGHAEVAEVGDPGGDLVGGGVAVEATEATVGVHGRTHFDAGDGVHVGRQ